MQTTPVYNQQVQTSFPAGQVQEPLQELLLRDLEASLVMTALEPHRKRSQVLLGGGVYYGKALRNQL